MRSAAASSPACAAARRSSATAARKARTSLCSKPRNEVGKERPATCSGVRRGRSTTPDDGRTRPLSHRGCRREGRRSGRPGRRARRDAGVRQDAAARRRAAREGRERQRRSRRRRQRRRRRHAWSSASAIERRGPGRRPVRSAAGRASSVPTAGVPVTASPVAARPPRGWAAARPPGHRPLPPCRARALRRRPGRGRPVPTPHRRRGSRRTSLEPAGELRHLGRARRSTTPTRISPPGRMPVRSASSSGPKSGSSARSGRTVSSASGDAPVEPEVGGVGAARARRVARVSSKATPR